MKSYQLPVLAIAAFSAQCFAQSSVTLFGVLDVGVSHYESKNRRDEKTSQTVQSISGITTSRIGFRGQEDLGSGLAAGFWLEAALGNDVGNVGGSVNSVTGGAVTSIAGYFSRRSTVSLSGPFGELRLGRDYLPTFWNDTLFDPFATNGVGSSLALSAGNGQLYRSGSMSNAIYARTSNSIGYFLPPKLGGIYGQFQYAFPEAVKQSNGFSSEAGKVLAGRIGYAAGPLDIAVSVGESTLYSNLQETMKASTRNVGASYDFGVVKLLASYSRVKDDTKASTFNANSNRTIESMVFGGMVPVGAGVFRASYSKIAVKTANSADSIALTGGAQAEKLALGYVHNLSKRTALYASIARIKSFNLAAHVRAPMASFDALADSSVGYDLGIRHSF